MRFFMDGRYIRTDYHDGISRFSHSLIRAVARQIRPTVLLHNPGQRDLMPDNVDIVKFHAPTSPFEPLAAYKLNRLEPDVVFSPMQTMGSIGRKFGLILTLHDLIYYQHRTPPRDLSQAIRGLWYLYHLSYTPQRILLNGADAVATVSSTSQRLIRKHRLTSRPVHVISNAPPEGITARDPHQPRQKTLVYMGSFMDYKNVETLIRSLQHLPDYTLHMCSPISAERRYELVALAEQHDVRQDQLVFHNGIADTEYHALLRTATALVTSSRSEGYGLPVAEAMSEGTPVVLSNLEIFQEIGGLDNPGALFIDIADAQPHRQLAEHVRTLEEDAVFVRASEGAAHQSAVFQWNDSATALLAVAQDIAQRRARSAR